MYNRAQEIPEQDCIVWQKHQEPCGAFRVNTVRKFLGSLYIGDFKERIILHPVSDLLFIKLMGKQVMAVHIKLKPERRPCRDAEIAETEFPVDKIEIVMKALALVELQEGLSGCFIMPWLVSITAFHGRENVDQAFCFPGFSDDLLDAVIFSESMEFSDKLNFNPILLSDFFRILTDLLRKGL